MIVIQDLNDPILKEIIRAATVAGVNEGLKQRGEWDYLKEKEAMDLLGVSKNTLAAYRNERKISYTRPGDRTILYSRKSIEAFLNSYKVNAK